MNYSEIFYNGGDICIRPAIRSEISDLIKSGISCDTRSNSNSDLKRKFRERGWQAEARIGHGRIDFRKEDVGLEVELRQKTNLIYDLLKLELAARSGIISC